MLPLGPTGYGDSPYRLFSAFAGNPLFISPELLVRKGHLEGRDLEGAPEFPSESVAYDRVSAWNLPLLAKAYRSFRDKADRAEQGAFGAFCNAQQAWLDDYALFIALKQAFGVEHGWTAWDPELVKRKESALAHWREKLKDEIECQKYWQFEFYSQWDALRKHANERGLQLMGDIPIYVAHDSSDVWAHPENFYLDANGKPTAVAGVPPDYFSATGQLWGNPIYRWPEMERSQFAWWTERFRAMFRLFDLVRLDHFRGFEAAWEVPADHPTAEKGKWVKGPGADLFRVLREKLGGLPFIAEDLGVITPEVRDLRLGFELPGMRILQFAFGGAPEKRFLPHQHERNTVVYTGTHDNDTTRDWCESLTKDELSFCRDYAPSTDDDATWDLIRLAWAPVADYAIAPLQDVLSLGNEARMNYPGRPAGNWRWRFRADMLTERLLDRLAQFTEIYERAPTITT